MIAILLASSGLYILFYLILRIGWNSIDTPAEPTNQLKFSVIIPVRNEVDNISNILKDLEDQHYSKDHFEVIIADDYSEDNIEQLIQEFAKSSQLKINYLKNKERPGKKSIITQAVAVTQFDYIISTDADCRLSRNWIKEYSQCYSEQINMVVGPVTLDGNGFFSLLQIIEYGCLMAFGAVTISKRIPTMCSGANLSFRKSSFNNVGGYGDNIHVASGDDEFLLYKISKEFPGSVVFLKKELAIVNTITETKVRSFINQRSRWTSKWKHHKNRLYQLFVTIYFLDAAITISGITFLLIHENFLVMALVILARFVSLFWFFKPITNFLNIRKYFFGILILQIFYPLYVFMIGLNSIFGVYTWKGRRYNDR